MEPKLNNSLSKGVSLPVYGTGGDEMPTADGFILIGELGGQAEAPV
jgi:hypothetical protein